MAKAWRIGSPCCPPALSAHSRTISRVSNAYMCKMSPKGMAPSIDRLPWNENTPVPAAFGCGNTCFPHTRWHEPPHTWTVRRHHARERGVQRAMSQASRAAGLTTRISSHPVQHSFATPLLQQGDEIRTVHARLGHPAVKTTMTYAPVLARGRLAVCSPLDFIGCTGHVPAFLEP
jgi:hypothetical protein